MSNFMYWTMEETPGRRTYTAPNNTVILVDRSGISATGNLRNFNSAVKRELMDVLADALEFYKTQQPAEPDQTLASAQTLAPGPDEKKPARLHKPRVPDDAQPPTVEAGDQTETPS